MNYNNINSYYDIFSAQSKESYLINPIILCLIVILISFFLYMSIIFFEKIPN